MHPSLAYCLGALNHTANSGAYLGHGSQVGAEELVADHASLIRPTALAEKDEAYCADASLTADYAFANPLCALHLKEPLGEVE